VLIESGDKESRWGTVGVSENIIEASYQALIDSIEFKLHKCEEESSKSWKSLSGGASSLSINRFAIKEN